jgi:3-dehydroquinate synthase
MEKIRINLGDRSYEICAGKDLLSKEDIFFKYIFRKNIAIITNDTVAPLYLEKLKRNFSKSKSVIDIILSDGEQFKNHDSLNQIYEALLKNKYGRDSILVALGGGVIGDITGYAAATYMRGIDFIQVPTSLLSQVDSSVGGKTGINHPLGKNMIGAFYQPKLVVIDVDCLKTLPDDELSAGLSEVIKYGLIRDSDFFEWLEGNIESLLKKNPDKLTEAIIRSCKNKAHVVAEDEFEGEKGLRATLNLGHTFGHAIETAMGYGNWLHGQAVAAGMVMAGYLSKRLGNLSEKDFNRLKNIIQHANLPVSPPNIDKTFFLDLMKNDKKNKDGKIFLVLLKGIGKAYITDDYPHNILEETIGREVF